MTRGLHRIIALAVALLWLPATLHCSVEAAAGLEADGCGSGCHAGSTSTSPRDGCDLVEQGSYTNAIPALKVALPENFSWTNRATLAPRRFPPVVAFYQRRPEREHPRAWVPVWHFARRDAAPARAPDSVAS